MTLGNLTATRQGYNCANCPSVPIRKPGSASGPVAVEGFRIDVCVVRSSVATWLSTMSDVQWDGEPSLLRFVVCHQASSPSERPPVCAPDSTVQIDVRSAGCEIKSARCARTRLLHTRNQGACRPGFGFSLDCGRSADVENVLWYNSTGAPPDGAGRPAAQSPTLAAIGGAGEQRA